MHTARIGLLVDPTQRKTPERELTPLRGFLFWDRLFDQIFPERCSVIM